MTSVRQADGACKQCGVGALRTGRTYCSRHCAAEGKRTAIVCRCGHCGAEFPVPPSALARGGGRFCSPACYHAAQARTGPRTKRCARCATDFLVTPRQTAKRFCSPACVAASMRKPTVVVACAAEACGRRLEFRAGARLGRFCSRRCSGRARRTREVRTCEACQGTFDIWPSATKRGFGRFCSLACRKAAPHRPTERSCARCGETFLAPPSSPKKYCSWGCYLGPSAGAQIVSCATCGRDRRVYLSTRSRGNGTFCSRACYAASLRKSRSRLTCALCRRHFSVLPSQAGQRFCSRACYRRKLAPKRFACRACRTRFWSRQWRNPKYCSIRCSNRARQRMRPADVLDRNRRILELHAQGLRAPAIRWELLQQRPSWLLSTGGIRTVVFREKKSAAPPARPKRR